LANILIVAETQKFEPTDYDKARQLIEAGYRATEQRRSELIRYRNGVFPADSRDVIADTQGKDGRNQAAVLNTVSFLK
jgi:hypothetical protein